MAQITALIGWQNKNYDYQITALARSLISPWVVSGLQVSAGSVSAWEGFLLATRSNGQQIMLHYTNTQPVTIDTTGNAKIYLVIDQARVDNGSNNNVDGTGLIRIDRGASYPSSNFIPLASITGWVITDDRQLLKIKINNTGLIDARNTEFPLPNKIPQLSNITEFRPMGAGWPVGHLWIPGKTGNDWAISITMSWSNEYAINIAYSAINASEMWIRRGATSGTTWGNWEKVYPFSATALDIWGLPEVTTNSSNYDFILMKYFNGDGGNKKITLENTRKLMLPSTSSACNILSTSAYQQSVWVTSTTSSQYLPAGGIVTLNWAYWHDWSATYAECRFKLQWSSDNSNWIDVYDSWNISADRASGSKVTSAILKTGYVRWSVYSHTKPTSLEIVIHNTNY